MHACTGKYNACNMRNKVMHMAVGVESSLDGERESRESSPLGFELAIHLYRCVQHDRNICKCLERLEQFLL